MPKVWPVVLAMFALSAGIAVQGQEHAPSTPEERARAVQIAQALEARPTDPALRDDVAWLVRWSANAPDFTVSMCSANMPWKGKYKYSTDLTAVDLAATTAFVIQHPNESRDPAAAGVAAMESTLQAYQKILEQDPKGHSKEMDEVVEIQKENKLDEYIRNRWAQLCKK